MSEAGIYNALISDATVNGLIVGRAYPIKSPQNSTQPYIVYRRVTGLSVNGLGGEMGTTNGRFQIDCYADTYAEVKTLSEAVKESFKSSSMRCVLIYDQDFDYEDEFEDYRVMLEFRIWFTE